MGYTHHFYRPRVLDTGRFRAFANDARIIVAALTEQSLQLAGPDGVGEPIVKNNLISFNGKVACGHPANSEISIPWPTDDAGGVAAPDQEAIAGEWGAGTLLSSRICNGDCSYESFIIERIYKPDGWERPKGGMYFAFCKTAFRPYDLAVIAVLIAFKKHFGDTVRVASDGNDGQWFDGKLLCKTRLDYGFNFQINDSGELVQGAYGGDDQTDGPTEAVGGSTKAAKHEQDT